MKAIRTRYKGPTDYKGSAIFGATLAALCEQVAPGYTSKQGEWWNTAQPLLADALRACDAFGYPEWQKHGVEALRAYVREHQLDGDWGDDADQHPDQHRHLVSNKVVAFSTGEGNTKYCDFAGCEG